MKYNLANYSISISPINESDLIKTITIGGEGDAIGSISVSRASSMYSTKGYATGAYVHTKNLDKTGTCSISINQLAEQIPELIKLANLLYVNDEDGFNISVNGINGQKVASCIDCYIDKIPDQEFADSAADQTWTFTCGQVNIGE